MKKDKQTYCHGYIGLACVTGSCPNAIEDEDGRKHRIKCKDCWFYKGCEDCAAPYYGCCIKQEKELNYG